MSSRWFLVMVALNKGSGFAFVTIGGDVGVGPLTGEEEVNAWYEGLRPGGLVSGFTAGGDGGGRGQRLTALSTATSVVGLARSSASLIMVV